MPKRHAFLSADCLPRRTYSLIGERQKGRVYYRCHANNARHVHPRGHREFGSSTLLERIRVDEQAHFKAKLLKLRAWTTRNWTKKEPRFA